MVKIPIYDLLIFLDEKGDTFEKKNDILDFVVEHYKCLTNITPNFSKEHAIETLCFCDNGLMANGNFPIKEGLLLKNKKGEYGITFRGQHNYKPDPNPTSSLWVWTLNEKGMLVSDTFSPNDWIKWGALTSLYGYFDYEEGICRNFGERDLKKGMIGKDVLMLQRYLAQIDEKTNMRGEFDEKTEQAVKNAQYAFGRYVSGFVRKEDADEFIR